MKSKLIKFLIIPLTALTIVGGFSYFLLERSDFDASASGVEHEENALFKVGKEEGEVIRELIVTMARTNPAVLAFKKGKLEALGAKLRSKVNTFEFLAFVFSDEILANEMKLLQESSIKYKRFVEGVSSKMLKEYEKEGFDQRVEHFAIHLEIDHGQVKKIMKNCLSSGLSGDKNAFMPFIDYLISVKAK